MRETTAPLARNPFEEAAFHFGSIMFDASLSSFELVFTSTLQQFRRPLCKTSSRVEPFPKRRTKSGVKSSSKTSTRKKTASRSKKSRVRRLVASGRSNRPACLKFRTPGRPAAGYYKQEPNGQWDDSTAKAMSTYQQDNGFRTTGKPDALSLKKLGL